MAWWLQTLRSVKDVLAMEMSDEVKFAAILVYLRATLPSLLNLL